MDSEKIVLGMSKAICKEFEKVEGYKIAIVAIPDNLDEHNNCMITTSAPPEYLMTGLLGAIAALKERGIEPLFGELQYTEHELQ